MTVTEINGWRGTLEELWHMDNRFYRPLAHTIIIYIATPERGFQTICKNDRPSIHVEITQPDPHGDYGVVFWYEGDPPNSGKELTIPRFTMVQ